MADEPKRMMSTEEVAFSRMGGSLPEALPADGPSGEHRRRLLAEIDRTMQTIIRRSNPVIGGGMPPLPTVVPAGAAPAISGPTSGWRDSAPLEVPGGNSTQRIIEAMANSFLPHGQPPQPPQAKKEEED
jgi:hypothetical protein